MQSLSHWTVHLKLICQRLEMHSKGDRSVDQLLYEEQHNKLGLFPQTKELTDVDTTVFYEVMKNTQWPGSHDMLFPSVKGRRHQIESVRCRTIKRESFFFTHCIIILLSSLPHVVNAEVEMGCKHSETNQWKKNALRG